MLTAQALSGYVGVLLHAFCVLLYASPRCLACSVGTSAFCFMLLAFSEGTSAFCFIVLVFCFLLAVWRPLWVRRFFALCLFSFALYFFPLSGVLCGYVGFLLYLFCLFACCLASSVGTSAFCFMPQETPGGPQEAPRAPQEGPKSRPETSQRPSISTRKATSRRDY